MPGPVHYERKNFRKAALINLGFLILIALAVLLLPLSGGLIRALLSAAMAYAACVYIAAAAAALGGEAAGERNAALTGLVMFCLYLPVYFLVRFAALFFLLRGAWPGTIAAAMCLWTAAVLAGTFQFYPVIRARSGQSPLSALKTCGLIFIRHPLFSLTSLAAAAFFSVPVITCPALPLLYLDKSLRRLDKQSPRLYTGNT